jgi:hypothetical protein
MPSPKKAGKQDVSLAIACDDYGITESRSSKRDPGGGNNIMSEVVCNASPYRRGRPRLRGCCLAERQAQEKKNDKSQRCAWFQIYPSVSVLSLRRIIAMKGCHSTKKKCPAVWRFFKSFGARNLYGMFTQVINELFPCVMQSKAFIPSPANLEIFAVGSVHT